MRSTSLGAMIHAWRDRARPDVRGAARRAPGLRREELAARAGLSVDYVVRLEQGRASHPSAQVVAALSRALRLSAAEKAHLHQLAGLASSGGARVPAEMTPGVKRMVDRLSDTPVAVFTSTWTFLYGNSAWESVFERVVERSERQPNLVWRMFLGGDSPVLRSKEEESAFAAGLVADLRGAAGRYPGDVELQAMIDALLERSEPFAALWKGARVEPHWAKRKTVTSRAGPLLLDCDVLTTEGDLRLVLYTAEAGSESERLLLQLVSAHEREGERRGQETNAAGRTRGSRRARQRRSARHGLG
ncbi:MAG: helix-turn-helix domain-containing protein [Archangium sp.]|nr:helix-turn-helix domain-containing protein [Archangium sp.]